MPIAPPHNTDAVPSGQGTTRGHTGYVNRNFSQAVCLNIIPIRAYRADGSYIEVNAFFDNGSTMTFATISLLNELGIRGQTTRISLSTLSKANEEKQCEVVSIKLSDIEGNYSSCLKGIHSCECLPIDPSSIPRPDDLIKWRYLEKAKINEIRNREVHILIGSDQQELIQPLEVIPTQGGGPYAVRYRFGWSLNGPIQRRSRRTGSFFIQESQLLTEIYSRYNQIEFHDSKSVTISPSKEDQIFPRIDAK